VNEKHMKTKNVLLGLFPMLASAVTAHAQNFETYTFTTFGGQPSLAIADGTASGVSDLRRLSSSITSIGSLTVSLNISGEFNGDLYAYLRHGDSGFSILLNRPGRTADSPSGYGDSGLNITLSDFATRDIHSYRAVVTPAAGSPLTGTWQPDGRNVDPSMVLDSTARTATLSSFAGLSGSGDLRPQPVTDLAQQFPASKHSLRKTNPAESVCSLRLAPRLACVDLSLRLLSPHCAVGGVGGSRSPVSLPCLVTVRLVE